MTFTDLAKSGVRTILPYVVGLVVAFAARHGVKLDAQMTAALSVIVGSVYWALVRLAERYVTPKFGWLLGLAQQPVYTKVRTRKDKPTPQSGARWRPPVPVKHHVRAGLTVVTIPEVHAPTAGRLGRHIEHDQRSRSFAITPADTLRSVSWKRHVPPFDQGQLGSCTGNAMAGVLSTAPFGHRFTERRAVTLYEAATRLDNVPGTYPPDDTGSSGLAVAKAAQQAKLITSYRHAFGGAVDVAHALQTGAGITGVNWYDSFDAPDSNGLVTITPGAAVRGGHEFEIAGVHLTTPGTISGDDLFECWQSWGRSWGIAGRFFLRLRDLDRLLHEQGDFTQPVR